MPVPPEIAFVTSNPGKAREASHFLGRPVAAVPLELPEIQSLDFAEVARAKALAAAGGLGRAVLVEDSGLEVAAWSGFPGPMTKWVTAGPVGPAGLARMLDAFPDRRATAVSALALARPGDRPEEVLVAVGRREGAIAASPRGAGGFGWDGIFVPDGGTSTYAEMSPEEKNRDSHRARAFAALRELLSRPRAGRPSP
ncbi:MAG TPA: non-canonical purine NTP pyrophosphatase [Thermoanaerobaculia bacterium]|nr:non-canonical purine NTP pyrophosphatase [Thermoanaerobaculia bacterium]